MPRLHVNRSAGARRGVTYVGASQHSTDDLEHAQKRARRQKVIPGWVGAEMVEEFDERIAGLDESISEREGWMEQDVHKLDAAQNRP